jgi:hypothetical protein
MTTLLSLTAVRDRYPTAAERDALTEYAAGIRDRQAAVADLEAIAEAAVADCMERMKQLYPGIPRYHAAGFEKGYRDNRILLTYAGRCMVLNDQQLLDDQVLVWVRTLFKSFNFTPKFLRDNFTLLRDAVRKRVRPRTYVLAEPFLTHIIEFLSDIPEPARPEV